MVYVTSTVLNMTRDIGRHARLRMFHNHGGMLGYMKLKRIIFLYFLTYEIYLWTSVEEMQEMMRIVLSSQHSKPVTSNIKIFEKP